VALQGGGVTLVALGVERHATLRSGTHLRWTIGSNKGFPPLGFNIFRRAHRPGAPRVLDLSNEAARPLNATASIGDTTWTTADNPPSLTSVQLGPNVVTVLEPAWSALTCRFAPADGLARRVEVDFVHVSPMRADDPPIDVTIWGVSGNERVASGTARLTFQNAGQIVTAVVKGDALDGFQVWAGDYGILRVRWTLVLDEVNLGWTVPLNPRQIGFPLTTPGYAVPHAYSPDAGRGQEDWHEASDRMRAGQVPVGANPLSALSAQRFGPPKFADFRVLMRKALKGASLVSQPANAGDPSISITAVDLTLLGATDPDFARLLGLGMVDSTAAPGERYDYKVVAYWPGEPHAEWVCTTPDPNAPGPPAPPPSPGVPVVTTVTVRAGEAAPLRARPLRGLDVPSGVDLRRVPGIDIGAVERGDDRDGRSERVSIILKVPATRRAAVTARSDGPEPLTVIAISGDTVIDVRTAAAGALVTINLSAPSITTIVVTGTTPTVTEVCSLQIVQRPVTEEWIAFDISLGNVPALDPPGPLSGMTMPSLAKNGSSEQVIGLIFQPQPAPRRPFDLFPMAKLPLDAVAYDIARRADGDEPVGDPANGDWDILTVDAVGLPRPIMRSVARPPAHRVPDGWPVESQDFIDGSIDAATRYYSYRVRGRDVFGRISDWSQHVTIDAADRIGPPAPNLIAARWLDRAHPWIDPDDAALLDERHVADGVLLRWGWPPARQEQAPDTRAFRVYWNDRSFSTMCGVVGNVQTAGDAFLVTVALPDLPGAPPTDAFAGDWLRQRTRQYSIRSSTAANPSMLTVAVAGMPAPVAGDCTLSLRGPDAARLDLLGNPLRRDSADPTVWQRRVAEGAILRHGGAPVAVGAGVAVLIQEVQGGVPRAGVASVALVPAWRWSGPDPRGLVLHVAGTDFPVLGGTLSRTATLFVDLGAHAAPPPGPATLADAAGAIRTISLPPLPANAGVPFSLVGGVLAGANTVDVLAHRATVGAVELAVDAPPGGGQAVWYPGYELLVRGIALPVSADAPHATGVAGLSAVDDRAYAADRRQVAGEPTSAGNEGVIATATVERRYGGAPAASPAPAGAGPNEIWAPPPEDFSGTSRFVLRWMPSAGDAAYVIHHASLDAVLDADAGDRAAARGAYVGQQPLAGAALAQWRQQQAALGPQALQALADAQPHAFSQLTPDPLRTDSALLADPAAAGGLRYVVPLDGSAPGRHFLRIQSVNAAGNRGPVGASTPPIVVPDVRRPLPARIRRVIEGDRAAWVVWDALDPALEYEVYRSQITAASQPDARDMALLGTVRVATGPEPSTVMHGEVHLPGAAPDSLVAVYRAEEYDPAAAPGAQAAAPVAGPPALAGRRITGLGALPDGTLVYGVVRYVPNGPPALAVPATSCAYHNAALTADLPYQYRVVARRQAAIGPQAFITVRSFPSNVGEGTPYDSSRPAPPAAAAAWNAARSVVEITWPTAGLAAGLEVALQRTEDGDEHWVRISGWVAASSGSIADAGARSGRSYRYRLRARTAAGRTSENEPIIGPIAVP